MDDRTEQTMNEEAREIRGIMRLDRMIHEPSRLAIMTILRRSGADYLLIRRLTGLSKSNLSSHIEKLEEAGLVTVDKHLEGRQVVNTVNLTDEGKQTIDAYWTEMRRTADSSEASTERRAAARRLEPRSAYGGAAGA